MSLYFVEKGDGGFLVYKKIVESKPFSKRSRFLTKNINKPPALIATCKTEKQALEFASFLAS